MTRDEQVSGAGQALLGLAETMVSSVRHARTTGLGASSLGQTLGVLEYLITAIYGFEANNELMGQSKMEGMQMASTLAQHYVDELPGIYWGSLTATDPAMKDGNAKPPELTPRQKMCMADIAGTGHFINVNPVEFVVVTNEEITVSYLAIWEDDKEDILADVADIDPGVKVVDRHVVYLAAGALSMKELGTDEG